MLNASLIFTCHAVSKFLKQPRNKPYEIMVELRTMTMPPPYSVLHSTQCPASIACTCDKDNSLFGK